MPVHLFIQWTWTGYILILTSSYTSVSPMYTGKLGRAWLYSKMAAVPLAAGSAALAPGSSTGTRRRCGSGPHVAAVPVGPLARHAAVSH